MKKKLPLNIIKGFQPKENENIYLVRPEKGEGYIVNFKDKDPESDFFFKIISFEHDKNKFHIQYKPQSSNTISPIENVFNIEELNKRFVAWTTLISEYNKTETIFDDPIIKGFADDYFNEIKIIDNDAEYKPFNAEKLLLLDEHLESIEKGIGKYQNSSNESVIKAIIAETKELRNELTKKSQNQILKKLVIIWAKISKQGIPLIKEFIKEGIKQAIRQGVKGAIEAIIK